MRKSLCLLLLYLPLSACVFDLTPDHPVGPSSHTCVVRDGGGRHWQNTGSAGACREALRQCQRWHSVHGSRGGHCVVM